MGEQNPQILPAFSGHQKREKILSKAQWKAVMALLQESSIGRAAAMAGVHERTLRRWMEEPAFKRACQTARRESFGQAIGLTQRYASVAVSTLIQVTSDTKVAAAARVAAAGMLLKFGREGIELDDIATRLEALERVAEADGNRRHGY